MADVDILIVGGGINGCGIARDAVGRGYSVALVEMGDIASATSTASTKMIHGGLRYLEYYEFRLVRDSLCEREVLWSIAPHIIKPLRLVLPYSKGLRSLPILRAGLFIYDHIGGRKKLPPTRKVDLSSDPVGKPLAHGSSIGFEYSDCTVMDGRLVVLNAVDAHRRGARIMPRTRLVAATISGDHWSATLRDTTSGATRHMTASMIVNAAGPWVDEVIRRATGRPDVHNIRLVQGSHIVVPKLYDGEHAYILQNDDGRFVFVLPFDRDFSLIGTTDLDYLGDPAHVHVSAEEKTYLLAVVARYFVRPPTMDDIVWSYSGIRPLFDDGASKAQEAARNFVLKVHGEAGSPQILNVFGGKITTYRQLAEEAMELIAWSIGTKGHRWTRNASLPGGNFPQDGLSSLVESHRQRYPDLDPDLIRRLTESYGTIVPEILGQARTEADLGRSFGAGLFQAEVDHLVANEFARTTDDILWRRGWLGLRVDKDGAAALSAYLDSRAKTG